MVRLENIIVDQNGQISITDKITLDKPDGVSITDKPVRQLASLWVDGNVGIGTKSPASKLEVSGTLKISGNGHIEVPSQTNENDAAIILGRSSGDPGSLFIVPKLGTGGYNGLSQEGDFGLFWRTNSKQDAGNLVIGPWNDTTAGIKITASGNVGIGTTNPERTLDIAGSIRGTGEIQTTSANAFRMVQGDYGLFLRNDGTNTYLLLTKAGDQYGNWNDLRPLSINNATGGVYLGNVGVNGDIAIDGKHAFRGSDPWLRLNQDNAFSSGVHTPGLFAPMSLNVGGVGGWGNPGNGNATFAGNVSIGGKVGIGIGTATPERTLDIAGGIRGTGEIQTTSANAFRMVQGDYGLFLRNDGTNTYLLLTKAGDQYGLWNDLRPLSINNATGGVYLGNVGINGDIAIDGKHALRGSDSWLRLNQDFAFSSGVHTPGLFAPKSLNVGGVGGWSNPGDGNATIAGNVSIGGEIQTTSANAFRMVQGNYGSFFRNDGSDTYLLLTNAGVPYGGWNDLRPLRINNASGGVYLGNLDVSDNFTATIRCGDFCMGHSSRRGTPGRALVDGSNTLHLNYGADWANVSIGGKVSTPSSRQLKENIQTLPSQLAKQIISTLEPVSFTYKHDSLKSQCLGFIAEDAPTEVASSNYDAIIMNHIVTALTRVVKDQEQTIAELAVQVNLLRNKNA